METFMRLYGGLIVFVYHCFDRIVINGYLSMLSRPENVVYFFHKVVGIPLITKEVLVQRTHDYQRWVEGFARNHNLPMQGAEKGVKKEEFVEPWLRRMEQPSAMGCTSSSRAWSRGRRCGRESPSSPPLTPITKS
jgi:hypothetical protein